MSEAHSAWLGLLATFAPVFTQPSFALWRILMNGWVLCAGRRTITHMITVVAPGGQHAHDAYHRFLRCGQWCMAELWHRLAVLLVEMLPPSSVIRLDVDDTLFHKSGRKVEGAGVFRDAVRSTSCRVVHALGLNLVVLSLRVTPPWRSAPVGLPVNLRLHRKKGPTYIELAAEMVREVAGWFPGRQFRLCGDGAYAPIIACDLPRTHVTSRLRSDAALYERPPRRRSKPQRGRPRKRGRRLPALKQIRRSPRTAWRRSKISIRGDEVARLLVCRIVLWYGVCKDRPLQLVIVRDPTGKEDDDVYICTDIEASAAQVASEYTGRWSIEETFRDVKQILGGEHPQCWRKHGPERAAALALFVYSLIWAWYLKTQGPNPGWIPSPWYTAKRSPAFADAVAALRRTLWRERFFHGAETPSQHSENVTRLIDLLAMAA